MTQDSFQALSEWYHRNCDGDWEHDQRIVIATLDNPGWSLEVNFSGTELESRSFLAVEREIDGDDWYRCWVEGSRFYGAGGPRNLGTLVAVFVSWAGK